MLILTFYIFTFYIFQRYVISAKNSSVANKTSTKANWHFKCKLY